MTTRFVNRSARLRSKSSRSKSMIETLEQRQLLSAAIAGVQPAFNDIFHLAPAVASGPLAGATPTTTVVTSSAQNSTSVYGTSVTFTATVNGDDATGTVNFFDGTTSLGTGTVGVSSTWTLSTATLSAGTHHITAVYGGDSTFDASSSSSFTATVTAKALTVAGITASNKVYDHTTTATLTTTNASLTGVIAGDSANVTLVKTNASGNFSDFDVGNGKTVTLSGLTLSGSAAGNYTLTQPTTTANISPKTLTITGVTGVNKVYNGSTLAGLSTGSAALSGVIAADNSNVTLVSSGATGAFVSPNASTSKAINVTGFTITGSASGDYTLAQPTTVTANITPKALTFTGITAANKVYDGSTSSTLNFTSAIVSGVLASDTANLNFSIDNAAGSFANANVGNGKTVTITGVAITGSAAGNYTITPPAVTANITPKPLTITGLKAANKVYDHTTTAALSTSSAAITGLVAADSGKVTLVKTNASGNFSDANVGNGKTVIVSGLALSGTQASNYSIGTANATANITPKTLTLSGVTGVSKVYDGTTLADLNGGSATLTGVVNADGDNVEVDDGSGTFASANVGNNIKVAISVVLGGSAAGNYTVAPSSTTANITPKAITVTGVTSSKAYDGTTSGATVDTSGAVLSGLFSGDAGKVTVAKSSAKTGVFSSANAGTSLSASLTGLTLSGTAAKNYTLTQPTITAHITPKAITVTGVTGNNKVYDGTTTAALVTTSSNFVGLVSADKANVTLSATNATANFASANVGTHIAISITGLSLTGSAAGNYTLTQPSAFGNITKKTLTVADIAASDKSYDGTTAATLDTDDDALVGVAAGDTSHVILVDDSAVGVFANKNAGANKTVTITGMTIVGSAASNYTLTQPTTTADITPKALTVTGITVGNKVYDGLTASPTPVTTGAALTGVISGDTVTLVKTNAAGTFANANVGNGKTVTLSGLTLSGSGAANYTITAPTTTANITPKALTVTGLNADKVYDGTTDSELDTDDASLSGNLEGDDVSLVTDDAEVADFDTANAGTHSLAVDGLDITGDDSGNYTLTQPTITAQITPKAITVTGVSVDDKTYDNTANATLDIGDTTFHGVVIGDAGNVTLVSTGATGTFSDQNVGDGKDVTITGLALGGSAAGNYTLTQPEATGAITPKAITVTGITSSNKVYDGTTDADVDTTSASFSGVFGADISDLSIDDASGSFATANAGTGQTVTITVELAGDASDNYIVTPATTTADITPLAVTVSGINADKTYNGTTAATLDFTNAQISGVVGGDDVSLAGTAGTFASKNVGTAIAVTPTALTLTGDSAGNYTLTQPTITADILAKELTVTGITASDKTFDDTTDATLNTTNAALVGVVAADSSNVSLNTNNAVGTFSDVGPGADMVVTIDGLSLTGSAIGNYTLTQPTTTASINPAS